MIDGHHLHTATCAGDSTGLWAQPVGGSQAWPPVLTTARRQTDSPYRLAFTYSLLDLIGDLENSERGDPCRS